MMTRQEFALSPLQAGSACEPAQDLARGRAACLDPRSIGVNLNAACRSEVSLWEDTARKSPGKARAWNNLGYAYQQAGRFRDAEAAYLGALRLDPGYALARGNLREMKTKSKTPGSPAPASAPAAPAAGAAPAREAAPAAPGG